LARKEAMDARVLLPSGKMDSDHYKPRVIRKLWEETNTQLWRNKINHVGNKPKWNDDHYNRSVNDFIGKDNLSDAIIK